VRRSVAIKASVVAEDERETGRRAILNAGHTVGHAVERHSRYRMAHGEAVAVGLVVESLVAEARGLAPGGLGADLSHRFRRLGLRLALPEGADAELLAAMRFDKKTRNGTLRLALPRAPGGLAGAPPWTRGHVGASAGTAAIAAAVDSNTCPVVATPVFGCALFDVGANANQP
jgi:3-dehydroquinate synthetase